jgi:hypothetical protein
MQTMGDIDEAWWKKELAKAEAAEKTKLSYIEPAEPVTDFEVIGELVGGELKKRDEAIQRLEERLALLEQDKAKHCGPYRAGRHYAAGEFATRSGSLWHCRKDFAAGTPGDESGEWKLVVKRGDVKNVEE